MSARPTPITDAAAWTEIKRGINNVWEVQLVYASLARTLERDRAELIEALEEIASDCADHPAYLGDDATEADMLREGGDAASITQWHHTATAAIAKLRSRA